MSKKKSAGPNQLADALALRAAGFTTLSIAQRTSIGVRTLQRHFSKHGIGKGELRQDIIEAARKELLSRVNSDDAIREEAAKLINDDLAHARHLRSILIEASEKLKAEDLKGAVLVMRAGAAYSTAIKNTSDVVRHALRLDSLDSDRDGELPELVIRELTESEINALRDEDSTTTDSETPDSQVDLLDE